MIQMKLEEEILTTNIFLTNGKKNLMKVVILAGGKGTRLSEYTKLLPKPMVKIGGKPIIEHIINIYRKYGFSDFIIATGYKSKEIKKFFEKKNFSPKININIVDTGLNTLTGLRIKKLEKIIGNERFMLTYGDGLSNVNIKKLINYHIKNKSILTLTAVHPPARFGELTFNKRVVKKFEEKPQLQKGWINGGFFVVEPDFFKILTKKNIMLEREPITKLVKMKKISAYAHNGFWYCMDNLRDKIVLEDLSKIKKLPWLN